MLRREGGQGGHCGFHRGEGEGGVSLRVACQSERDLGGGGVVGVEYVCVSVSVCLGERRGSLKGTALLFECGGL